MRIVWYAYEPARRSASTGCKMAGFHRLDHGERLAQPANESQKESE